MDTNVLIDAERSTLDLDTLIADDEPAVAAITIAELGVGVDAATGKRRQARKAFLDDIIDTVPIISYDSRSLVLTAGCWRWCDGPATPEVRTT